MSLEFLSQSLKQKAFPIPFGGHWVGGEWVNDPRAQSIGASINPSHDEVLMEVSLSKFITDQAIDAAEAALKPLAVCRLDERIHFIEQFRHLVADYEKIIVETLTIEAGKPLWEAQHDFNAAIRLLDQVLCEKEQIIEKVCHQYAVGHSPAAYSLLPLGIVSIFQTFSTPLNCVVQSLAAGLIAACPLIVMSSTHAALMGRIVSCILEKIDLPKGSINLLFGNYKYFSKSLQDRRIKGVVYSGSREHCDTIRNDYANSLGRQLMLQSGGKNSLIIHETGDMDLAMRAIVHGMVKSAGQLNTSTGRVFVHESQLEAFRNKLIPIIRSLSIGATDTGEDPMMGPLYSKKAVDKFLRFQTMAKRESTDAISWGKAIDVGTNGYFVTPGVHVFDKFDGTTSYQSNVILCPDIAVYPYNEIDQAIAWSNHTKASLVTSIVGNVAAIKPLLPALKAPNVMLNQPTVGAQVHPTLAGRELCGGHRVNGLGLLALMTYPQACHGYEDSEEILKVWPWN